MRDEKEMAQWAQVERSLREARDALGISSDTQLNSSLPQDKKIHLLKAYADLTKYIDRAKSEWSNASY